MKALTRIPVLTALLLISPLCLAGPYLGAGATSSEYQYDDIKHGFGGEAFLGYRLDRIPLMFEAGFVDTGKAKIDNFVDPNSGNQLQNSSLSFKGGQATVGLFGKFDAKGSAFFGKLGYYTGKAAFRGTFNGTPLDFKETSKGFMFGGGLDWMLSRYVGLRFEIDSLQRVKDLPQLDPNHKSNITLASLGLVLTMPAAQRAPVVVAQESAAPVVPAPAKEVPAAAAPPVQDTAPAAAPVPEAAAAAPPTTLPKSRGLNAQARPGATVRDQPTLNGPIALVLAGGGPVDLISRTVNSTGGWWYVRSGSVNGWIKEEQLQLAAH